MNLDTTVIEQYFLDKSIENAIDHWIFKSIVPGEHLFEEPPKEDYYKIKEIYEILLESLKDFKPWNLPIWEQFFGGYNGVPEDIIIYFIVGSPNPYDAMVRQDREGNKSIIFDLARIGSYSKDINEIEEIIISLITHEVAHIYIGKEYKYPSMEDSIYNILQHIVFDEGIAHFLSFNRDLLSLDWYTEDMLDRREKAYLTLLNNLNNNLKDMKKEIITKADTGPYWEKFAAISGLFGIYDYYNSHSKDLACFREIFEGGPKFLLEFIMESFIKV